MVIDDILNNLEDRLQQSKKALASFYDNDDLVGANYIKKEIEVTESIKKMIQKKTEGMSYIGWSVEDFKYQASNQEDPSIYDETKFKDALDTMINKHDASIGITWETIAIYLDNYCIKENRRLNMEEELSPFERLFLEKAITNFRKVMIDITKESIEEGADPFITEELITVTAKSLKDKLLKKE